MLQYHDIAAGKAFFISDISRGFCNVLYALACYCKKNITMFKIFWICYF